jgi:hypothetical protein
LITVASNISSVSTDVAPVGPAINPVVLQIAAITCAVCT